MTDNENVEHQPGIPASELPEADSLDEWKDLDEMPPVHARPANNPPPGVRRKPQVCMSNSEPPHGADKINSLPLGA